MSYSSVWTRVFRATAAPMIGWIVFCWTLASIRSTTCPPRWIRPSTGGLSFASVPRPGPAPPPAVAAVRAAPFCDVGRPALVPGDDVDLVDLHLAFQRRRGGPGRQAVPQLLGHELRVRAGEAQLLGDLPVGEVQAHEVEAQHPDAQRLVVPGQDGAGQVVEAVRARLAAVALPLRLRVVTAVAHHGVAAASGAADALRPAMLPHQGEVLSVVDQRREVDQIRGGHGGERSSAGGELPSRSSPPATAPARPPFPPSSTPDPEKSVPRKLLPISAREKHG